MGAKTIAQDQKASGAVGAGDVVTIRFDFDMERLENLLSRIIEVQVETNEILKKIVFCNPAAAATAANHAEEFMGMEQAARFLHRSRQSLYDLVSSGKIKVTKSGSKNLFTRTDLLEYLNRSGNRGRRRKAVKNPEMVEVESAETTDGGEPKKNDNHNQRRGTTRQSISSFEKYGI